jgi:hypothetical protein
MFFRTYMGEIPDQLQQQGFVQLPCWGMKHFYAEFVSNARTYPYFQGTGAVVIAKYYEGARINGSVKFMGDLLQAQVVVQKNAPLYGTFFPVDHDTNETKTGTFSVLAPAGNITLQIRRNTELGINAFVMKTVTFNSTSDPELAPITDDEAMRKQDTNYERAINITVDPATVEGYIYKNNDENTSYNSSVDEPLENVQVVLLEIEEFDPDTGTPVQFNYSGSRIVLTNKTGYYNASELKPGIYFVRAMLDDYVIHEGYAFMYSGNNSYNISKPLPATVNGTIYFDENSNSKYDTGEEMDGVTVDLLYTKLDGSNKFVSSLVTEGTGSYSFASLILGQYVLNATKTNRTTGQLDYAVEENITLQENETKTFNVSITYAPITVRGYTKHGERNIGELTVKFSPDTLIKNNTAKEGTSTADNNGYYTAKLMPGYYNVSVDESVELGTYSFEGKLVLQIGEGVKSYDIPLTKESVTVSGTARYDTTGKFNVTISFYPNEGVENNTAEYADVLTAENGSYVVELMPGSYNVSVDEPVEEGGANVTYSFNGSLEVSLAQPIITYDIPLARTVT